MTEPTLVLQFNLKQGTTMWDHTGTQLDAHAHLLGASRWVGRERVSEKMQITLITSFRCVQSAMVVVRSIAVAPSHPHIEYAC